MSHERRAVAAPTQPNVILLNGCSGAGKSSIGLALQGALSPPHVLTGVDDFAWRLMPPQWLGSPEGVQFRPMPDGSVPLHRGPGALAMQKAFHRSVAAMADCGLHVIVDDVVLDPEALSDWLVALTDASVFFVGVHCDFEELRRREAARPDRALGHMQTHFAAVHAHGEYDLEIDTTTWSTPRCAGAIVAALREARAPSAFERLRLRQ